MTRLELIFDSEEARHSFVVAVLDCNILDDFGMNAVSEGSSDWTKGNFTKLRIEGSGEMDEDDYDYD